jgi:hypothetical protein
MPSVTAMRDTPMPVPRIGLIKTPPSASTGWVNPYIMAKGK